MVSNASDDLPEPDMPVMTTSLSRGISTSMFFRLCARAPLTTIFFIPPHRAPGSRPPLQVPEPGYPVRQPTRSTYMGDVIPTTDGAGSRAGRKLESFGAHPSRGAPLPPARPKPRLAATDWSALGWAGQPP